jgi:hypothetical protein
MLKRQGGPRVGLLLAILGLALLVAGCGGGGSSSSSQSTSAAAEPSAQFRTKNGKNTIPTFGEEASEAERETANAVVVESLEAREAADFKTQCETLNETGLEGIPNAKNRRDCPAALKEFAEPLPSTKKIRKDTLSGSITAFRVKGESGYALYHGNDGNDYALPLEKEGGSWKVSAVNTIKLESSPPETKPESAAQSSN